MSSLVRRDLVAGALAGLVAGLAVGWALRAQGMLSASATLGGLPATPLGLALDLLLAALIGASFGALFRYQPGVDHRCHACLLVCRSVAGWPAAILGRPGPGSP